MVSWASNCFVIGENLRKQALSKNFNAAFWRNSKNFNVANSGLMKP